MTNESVKPPTWFWVVAVIALLWNLMGVLAYLGEALATPEMLEAMPDDQRNMIENRPAWATAAFAIAVWGGAIGSLLLLLRKGLAYTVLIASLIGVIVQMIYNLFIAESTASYGPGEIAMVIMIPLIGILLVLFAKRGKASGWLK
ncbi:hypothetical protein [Ekhidna sp.]|uniref:hypothetical protein n=1 Tax=Ekhidna sp. TaxID=2608089 RepID=UPI003C7B8406